MNHTTNQTTITVSITNASTPPQTAIRKRVERDNRTGQPRTVESIRGIRI